MKHTVTINIKSEKFNPKKFKNCGGEVIDKVKSVPINNNIALLFKWAWQDSNLRPTDYESVALTN